MGAAYIAESLFFNNSLTYLDLSWLGVFGIYLEGFGGVFEGFWRGFEGVLEGFWRGFGGVFEGVLRGF